MQCWIICFHALWKKSGKKFTQTDIKKRKKSEARSVKMTSIENERMTKINGLQREGNSKKTKRGT